jgi:hypothetical protein
LFLFCNRCSVIVPDSHQRALFLSNDTSGLTIQRHSGIEPTSFNGSRKRHGRTMTGQSCPSIRRRVVGSKADKVRQKQLHRR